jgi:hypothetical protein
MGDSTPATLPTNANTSSTTTNTLPTTTNTLLGQAITPAPATTLPPAQAQVPAQAQANTSTFSNLATTANMTMLLGFLGIYFIIYFVLGKFYNNGENPSGFNMSLSKTLDMLFLVMLAIITYSVYETYQTNPDVGFFEGIITKFGNYINNPSSAFTTTAIIIIFYTVAYLFGIPMDSLTKPMFMSIIEGGVWLLLIIILFVDFFKYVLKISFYDLFPFFAPASTPKPDETAVVPKDDKCKTEPTEDPKSEVFNIANNKYTYEDAQAICKAYDSTLATYDQIENAYNNGAEWCNYGWSAGQMILFPTQKKTWEKLQKVDENRGCAAVAGQQTPTTPSHKNDCGRPGINGGYIANPYVRFGVNCFGKKPAATDADKVRMNARQNQVYPKTPAEQVLENKVNYWKENADKFLQINSYSTNAWNKAESSAK